MRLLVSAARVTVQTLYSDTGHSSDARRKGSRDIGVDRFTANRLVQQTVYIVLRPPK